VTWVVLAVAVVVAFAAGWAYGSRRERPTAEPPPLLDSPTTPDDLKLIVGVGPVMERMLYQLGITTYRQIARWTDRDIDEIDARLPEFPGRIRRDEWVTQARALHQSKYGEAL
jgi:predicted flap endonuclease-1-like 5' DNA nuclease